MRVSVAVAVARARKAGRAAGAARTKRAMEAVDGLTAREAYLRGYSNGYNLGYAAGYYKGRVAVRREFRMAHGGRVA